MPHIKIIDVPCGYGKSTRIINSFDKRKKYIAVVPYLSEAKRFAEDARKKSGFLLTEPASSKQSKSDHCEKLIRDGKSIVCTHALFYRLGTMSTFQTDQIHSVEFQNGGNPKLEFKSLLHDYNVIIDEVITPFEIDQTVRKVDFDADYLGLGLATELDDGRIVPTPLWDEKYTQGSKTFSRDLYEKAKSGGLYRVGENLFVLTVPTELLLKPKTVSIYTYLSKGSVLLQFLYKLRASNPNAFTLSVERLPEAEEAAWREDVANALTVLSIPGLEKQPWNHSAQIKGIKKHSDCASIGHELRKFKNRNLHGVDLSTVMLTSAREIWHGAVSGKKPIAGRLSKHSRMFGHPVKQEYYDEISGTYLKRWSTTGVTFVPNTTRGTNDHVKCTTAIYLYDQNPNPQMLTFLGFDRNSLHARCFSDAYALTEVVQWLFRSAIRVGGQNNSGQPRMPRHKVTVYMPSERMRNLLLNWLLTGNVNSGPVMPKGQKQIEMLARLEGHLTAAAA